MCGLLRSQPCVGEHGKLPYGISCLGISGGGRFICPSGGIAVGEVMASV